MGTTTKEPDKPESEVFEPGGRKRHFIEKMSDEALAAAYGDAVRFRSHGADTPGGMLDETIGRWLKDARAELRKRGRLHLVKDHLAIYYDPSRTPAIFGPGAEPAIAAAIEKAAAEQSAATEKATAGERAALGHATAPHPALQPAR